MADTDKKEEQQQEVIYSIGNRVILNGLQTSAHLNGQHGTIGSLDDSGRYSVYLDTMLSQVNSKSENIQPEPSIPPSSEENRAGCTAGILVESHGRAVSHLLDLVRFIVGNVFTKNRDINDMRDVERLRKQGSHGLMILNQLTAMGWSHWLDSGSFHVPSKKRGVYGHIVEYLKEQVPEHNPESVNDPTVKLMTKALEDVAAVGGWHVRVHGNFWIVGEDETSKGSGTYLIPDSNQNMVFKVLGIRNNLYALVKNTCQDYSPMKMVVTMVPWYGRLVYDGVVVPASAASGTSGPPGMANPALTAKLKQTVIDAEERGCVIERLAELEIQGSESYLPDLTLLTLDDADNAPQEEITQTEKLLLALLAPYATPEPCATKSRKPKTFWTMRRFGYTEEDNPDHFGVIMNNAHPIGDFTCTQGLAPISIDILSSLIKVCTETNNLILPTYLNIDHRPCFLRVKYLFQLERIFSGTDVLYYHPPSVEETDAATVCSSGGPRSKGSRIGGGQAA